jgi:uncharacterized membrane protein YfcA
MEVTFPISGVETQIWLPPLVAMTVSFFSSMAGISGAFLLLPFQMSVLGFVSPAVSPTNLVFNIVAIPGGVYRYFRENRIIWPLAWIIVAGSAPGVVVGGLIRLQFLPDPQRFIVFAGCVLLYIGGRLFAGIRKDSRETASNTNEKRRRNFEVTVSDFSWRRLEFGFDGQVHRCKSSGVFLLSLVVGVLGGVYGIGGGAIIAPFLVAIYNLPIYTVAGATLIGTFVASVVGVVFYQAAAPFYSQMNVTPDWMLGGLFGLGGFCGMYLGARAQRFVPSVWLKLLIGVLLLYVALRYLSGLLEAIN